ncbi:MAG: RNA-directed DNA polymerase [Mycobacteriales bacterium]|nr:MAG: hypothetical protein DLM56_05945 [Pseudonocardiales bacterium]
MAKVDWAKTFDLKKAVENLRVEMVGDWHQDPWGWPELGYILNKEPQTAFSHCDASGTRRPALVDVPKENWGTRPAVVLDIVDRVVYQALVDRLSVQLIGDMSPNAFGWRLPPTAPAPGVYSHNNNQWAGYRGHLSLLAGWHQAALRTDLVSFFASIPVPELQEAIQDRCASSAVTKRLCDVVEGFGAVPGRSGLAQRSTASAVLANMYLAPLDDVLLHHATPLMVMWRSKVRYHSFARWMDDIWLFVDDPAAARRAQMELQAAAQSLGLNLNSAKTDVLEGDDVAEQAREIEHSAVDGAIEEAPPDYVPLEELIDRILDNPEKASRTSLKFATQRMRDKGHEYRVSDLALAAKRMPHAADALARLFKHVFTHSSMQEWYLEYATSDWTTHEWSVAQLGRIFPSSKAVRKPLREFFANAIRDANTGLPLLSVAAQRLGVWDPPEARDACRDAFRRAASPQARRVLALTALGAGETRTKVRSWLKADPENDVTLRMLESCGFVAPPVSKDFAV